MLEGLSRTLGVSPAVFSLGAVIGLLVIALVVGFVLNRVFHRYARRFENSWGHLFFSLLESLPIPLLVLAALYNGLEMFSLPPAWEQLGSKLILALVILVVFYFPAKVLIIFLERLQEKEPALERITQPAAFLIRALFALVAIIVVLENLGVHLTAVWTTLGVGSVAVALALQETLSNFFAGLYLMADRPISPGDYVKLDAGQEGYVIRIGWRSTLIRTLPNNIVVVPNSTLAKAIITNYSRPDSRMSLIIPVSVAYGTDTAQVEKILVEIAEKAGRDGLEGLLPTPAPFVRLIPGFGASSLDFSLIVQIHQFTDQYLVQSELRKGILARFEREGIAMPFPTQSILIEKVPPSAPRDGGAKA
jgi:small-conductance mechanosensitive channel